jgi:hypothetical protein
MFNEPSKEEIQEGLDLGTEICRMILKPGAHKSISAVAVGSVIATIYATLMESPQSGAEQADAWVEHVLSTASSASAELGNTLDFALLKKDVP